jgi:hypothetical protein
MAKISSQILQQLREESLSAKEDEKEEIKSIIIRSGREVPTYNVDPEIKLSLEEIGKKAEMQKMHQRTGVLVFLCIIISVLVWFISKLTWLIATKPTYISSSVYKYFISGVFINLVVLFRGITNYLYNNKSHSLVEKVLADKKLNKKNN